VKTFGANKRQTAAPVATGAAIRLRKVSGNKLPKNLKLLVEVAGIEPASENLSRQASTCLVRVLLNP